MKNVLTLSVVLGVLALGSVYTISTYSHCQVPCGIYGDEMKFEELQQHVDTIEKAMNSIQDLSEESDKNYNQIVRWVNNKEEHAEKIMTEAQTYFLAQRVKPADPDDEETYKKYMKDLELLHHIIVFSMKCKQTTDLENVKTLRSKIDDYYVSYFGPDHEKHTH